MDLVNLSYPNRVSLVFLVREPEKSSIIPKGDLCKVDPYPSFKPNREKGRSGFLSGLLSDLGINRSGISTILVPLVELSHRVLKGLLSGPNYRTSVFKDGDSKIGEGRGDSSMFGVDDVSSSLTV